VCTSNRNYGMITLDKNHEIWPRESPTDKLGLTEIRIQFNSPRKKFWRFLQTVKNEKNIASKLSSPYPTLILKDSGCWWPIWPRTSSTSLIVTNTYHLQNPSPTSINLKSGITVNQTTFAWNILFRMDMRLLRET